MDVATLKSQRTMQTLPLSSVMGNEGAWQSGEAAADNKLMSSCQSYLDACTKEQGLRMSSIPVSPQALIRASNNREVAFMVLRNEAAKAIDEIKNNQSEDELSVLTKAMVGEAEAGAQTFGVTSSEKKKTGSKDIDNLLEMYDMADAALKVLMEAVRKVTDYYQSLVELKRLLEQSVSTPDNEDGKNNGEVIIDFDREVDEFMGEKLNPPIKLSQLIQGVRSGMEGDDGHLITARTEEQAQEFADKLGGAKVVRNDDGTFSVRIDLHSLTQFQSSYAEADGQQYAGGGKLSSAQYSALTQGLSAAQNTADSMMQKVANGGSYGQQNHESFIKLITSIITSNLELIKTTNSF